MADAPARGGVWSNSGSCVATRQRVNFNAEPEIDARGRWVGRYFQAKLPPKGRLERGTPVGVLVGRNGGHWKKLLTAEYSNNSCGLPELTTRRNPNPSILKLFYGSDTMLRENEYIDSH